MQWSYTVRTLLAQCDKNARVIQPQVRPSLAKPRPTRARVQAVRCRSAIDRHIHAVVQRWPSAFNRNSAEYAMHAHVRVQMHSARRRARTRVDACGACTHACIANRLRARRCADYLPVAVSSTYCSGADGPLSYLGGRAMGYGDGPCMPTGALTARQCRMRWNARSERCLFVLQRPVQPVRRRCAATVACGCVPPVSRSLCSDAIASSSLPCVTCVFAVCIQRQHSHGRNKHGFMAQKSRL
jgi:hypothetical protein